jgi:hypothetical protein
MSRLRPSHSRTPPLSWACCRWKIVDLLCTNVEGVDPSQTNEALFTGWVDSGAWTVSSLANFAVEAALNANNISTSLACLKLGWRTHPTEYIG